MKCCSWPLILALAISIGIALVVAVFFAQPKLHKFGGGKTSPDGRYLANVFATVERRFLRPPVCYYEVTLFGPSSSSEKNETNYRFSTQPIARILVPVLTESELRKTRGESPFPIEWEKDSRSVAFIIGHAKIQFASEK